MTDGLTFALANATLGVIVLAISLLASRVRATPAYVPLGVALLGVGVMVAQIIVATLAPQMIAVAVAVALPALLTLGPALYLYVVALTTEGAWRWNRRDAAHAILPAVGAATAALFIMLPSAWRDAMILRGELPDHLAPKIAALSAFALVLAWAAQSGVYLAASARRLVRYRRRLKDLFASTEDRELQWISWLLVTLGALWALAITTVLADNLLNWLPFGPRAGAAMGLVLVWFVSLWGLRQAPGFEDRAPPTERSMPEDPAAPAKYERSGVSGEQAARLAKKIDAAMRDGQLYLEPDLSLHRLAQHVRAPAHRVSQILNETIGETFFDYVNRWRIEAAKPLVSAGEQTVLAIALEVGFNARSSFYKAFRRETGLTPTAYRQHAGEKATVAARDEPTIPPDPTEGRNR